MPTFQLLQTTVRERRYDDERGGSGGRKGIGFPNLFLGLGKCECLAPLSFESAGGSRKKRRTLVCSDAIRSHGRCKNRKEHFYPAVESEFIRALSLFDYTRLLAMPQSNFDRGAELAALIADHTETQRALLERFKAGMPATVLERVAKLESELETLRGELREYNDNIGGTAALRERNSHAEFVKLVGRMNSDMDADERFVLRTKLAQEFKRLFDEMVGDAEGITVRLKSGPSQRIEFRFADRRIQEMLVWSRWAMHRDYPNNPMRPFLRVRGEDLEMFDPGQFEYMTVDAA